MPATAGSVYKRQSDSKWCAAVVVNGKRKVVYGATEAEAKRKLAALQRQVAVAGSLPDPGRRTMADLIKAFLSASRASLKPRTLHDYAALSRRYIEPDIGRVRLSAVEPGHFQRLYADMQAKGLVRPPAQVHALLHRACHLGVLWGWLAQNPADRVLKPSYVAPRKDVWSAEQAKHFLAVTAESRFGPLWALLAYGGLRLGEALALRWDDMDLDAGTVAVRRTLHRIAGAWVETTPKTRAGTRTIALPPQAVAALRAQRARQVEQRLKVGTAWSGEGRVFAGLDGSPLGHSQAEHRLPRDCAHAGVPTITPHGLRHLSASLMLSAGLSLPDVSRRLGHANVNVTATIYAHAVPGRDRLAADALDRMLGGEAATG